MCLACCPPCLCLPSPCSPSPFLQPLASELVTPSGPGGGRREAWQLAGTWFRASSPCHCPGLCALLPPLHTHSRCHALALISNPPPSRPLTSSAGQGLCLWPQPCPCGSGAVSALLSSRSSVLFPISSAVPMLCRVPPVAFPPPASQQLLGQLPPHAGPSPTPPALAARGRAGHEGSSPAWLSSQRAAWSQHGTEPAAWLRLCHRVGAAWCLPGAAARLHTAQSAWCWWGLDQDCLSLLCRGLLRHRPA